MTRDGSWSVSFGPGSQHTLTALNYSSNRAHAKQALNEVGTWFSQAKTPTSTNISFEVSGGQSASLLNNSRAGRQRPQQWPAAKSRTRRPEHEHLPWASLSFGLPAMPKRSPPLTGQQANHTHVAATTFETSSNHVLPACHHMASASASIPPNKRRCIPWHQAEFSLPAQPKQQHRQQPMLASVTASFGHNRSSRTQPRLVSTHQTARRSGRPSDSSVSNGRRHMHSPVLCLASAASRAVDEDAEEMLLTRTKDLGFTVKDKVKTLSRRMPNQMRRLVAGAIAGALSKTAIAPIETIRMQVMGGKGGVAELIGRTWRRKGVLGFFNGNSADILRVVPSKAIELSAFDAYKKFLSREDEHGKLKRPGPLLTGLAGAAAGMTSTLALYPLETLRTRLAMGDYDNMAHAVRAVAAEEGPMAFYQGISASLIGILPYAAIRLGVYDGLKWTHKKFAKDEHIPALNTALYGAFAGLVSATATFPVEVVRRRMMVGTVKGSTWAALTTIAKNEGWRSLYKGIGLTWAKQAPQYAVTFLAYDLIKEYLEV